MARRARRTGRPGPLEPPRTDTIRAALRALIRRKGSAEFRMEELAREAGVAKVTIYKNWPDSRDLSTTTALLCDLLAKALPSAGSCKGPSLEDELRSYFHYIRRA